jgi:3-oxoacyl-[acyl-carrier-protein] synthase-3
MLRSRITGTGSALPEKILSNQDLKRMVDSSDVWITSRTGFKQRRIAAEGEFTSTFAVEASRRAMEEAACTALTANGMTASDVTLFIPHQANIRIIDAAAKRWGFLQRTGLCKSSQLWEYIVCVHFNFS